MKRTTIAVLILATLVVATSMALVGASGGLGLKDEGVGMYTDPSVANQASSFTINRQMVSCGVGTADAMGVVGPFEMLMYALSIDSYTLDRTVFRPLSLQDQGDRVASDIHAASLLRAKHLG